MAPTTIVPMPIEKFATVSFTSSLPGLCNTIRINSRKNAANNTEVPITFVLCMVEWLTARFLSPGAGYLQKIHKTRGAKSKLKTIKYFIYRIQVDFSINFMLQVLINKS